MGKQEEEGKRVERRIGKSFEKGGNLGFEELFGVDFDSGLFLVLFL